MIKYIKTYLVPFMVLFTIFIGEMEYSILILSGSIEDSNAKYILAIFLAVIGYSLFIGDLLNGKIQKRDKNILLVLFLILILYLSTSFFYGLKNKYISYLLAFVAESIPAAYIGIRLSKSPNIEKINVLLPFFIIPTTLLIGTIGLRYAMMAELASSMSDESAGLGYQSLSYFMAFSYSYSCYFLFIMKGKTGIIWFFVRCIMALLMLFSALICLTAGGRGGFVFIVAISLFLLYYYIKSSKKSRIKALLVVTILILLIVYLIGQFNVMESVGMERVMDRLTEDDARKFLFQRAYDAFLEAPIIGNGVGSIWWTVGFFSHNMFMDILAETGVVGGLFFSSIILFTIRKLLMSAKAHPIYILLFIVFFGALVHNMFSGYWVSAIKLFFVCSFVFSLSKRKHSFNEVVGKPLPMGI